MNIEDLDSDVSDEDYVPDGQNAELPSEEESDGDVEDDLVPNQSKKRGKSSKKPTRNSKKAKTEEVEDSEDDKSPEPSKPLTVEEEKKKSDSLWADFLKDTNTKPRTVTKDKVVENKSDSSPTVSSEKKIEKPIEEKKVKVTKIFEFAGEEVRVEKEVPVNSLEAKLSSGSGGIATRGRPARGRGSAGGGLSSVLSQIGKKQKISTLEKTKLDWDKFKKEEDIEEELQNFNKGKNGYLERQDFLQRADLRQFEIEKEIRATHRSQRL